MSNEEDDDAFLYGSDDDSVNVKRQKLDTGATVTKTVNEETEKNEIDESNDDNESDDDEDDDDSDSDIEFIVTTEDNQKDETKSDVPTPAITSVTESIDEINELNDEGLKTTATTTTEATITRIPEVDINKIGEFEGQPITKINLQDLKEKPWRKPGADISEYFNYGFDEFTWVAYCSKQDHIRSNFNNFNYQKMLMNMMPMMMPGMPPLPNMPQIPVPTEEKNDTESTEEKSKQQQPPPPPPAAGSQSFRNIPRAPSGPSRNNDRDYKDREFERGYNNDYRERDSYRGGRGRRRR